MNNIIHKIRQIYPVSEEALQALLMNMQVRHYPKGTYIVQAGVTDRLVYFIEEGVTRSVFHHDGQDTTRKVMYPSEWIHCTISSRQ